MHYPFRYSLLTNHNEAESANDLEISCCNDDKEKLSKLTQTSFYSPLQYLFAQLQESLRKFGETEFSFIFVFIFIIKDIMFNIFAVQWKTIGDPRPDGFK
jgi:hypothetical protein